MSLRGFQPSSQVKEEIANLYCIAYNQLDKRAYLRGKEIVWTLKFHYLHAVDAQNARYEFIMAQPHKSIQGLDIVSIAPVIGRHVEDTKGDKLSL